MTPTTLGLRLLRIEARLAMVEDAVGMLRRWLRSLTRSILTATGLALMAAVAWALEATADKLEGTT